jgi:hypothetical protein
MLAVPADRLPAALADLDPGNRALLDLSLRRGVSDAEIGELLRKTPDEVARGRDAVLELLADALAVDAHDRRERVRRAVVALPDDAWRTGPAAEPRREPEPAREGESESEPEQEPEREPERERLVPRIDDDAPPTDDDFYFAPEPRRSRRGSVIAVVGLLAIAGALAALLLGGGDDDEPASDAPDQGAQPTPPPDNALPRRGVALERLTGGRGRGRVAPGDGGVLVISLRGLPRPDGAYEAWLYDSVVDAQSLGRFEGANGRLQGRLPNDAGQYRFLDISREPADGNPNHSGESVLRVPLRQLGAAAPE